LVFEKVRSIYSNNPLNGSKPWLQTQSKLEFLLSTSAH
jgi:hypothetical protein